MRKLSRAILCCAAIGACAPESALAADTDIAQDLGSVLAWRLGPEAVAEKCRAIDPDGAAARQRLLETWADKNAALIRQVDERVAEVVPLMYRQAPAAEALKIVRAQVKDLVLESVLTSDERAAQQAACKAESDPANARWTSNAMRQVQEALAALYDWKVQQERK